MLLLLGLLHLGPPTPASEAEEKPQKKITEIHKFDHYQVQRISCRAASHRVPRSELSPCIPHHLLDPLCNDIPACSTAPHPLLQDNTIENELSPYRRAARTQSTTAIAPPQTPQRP